MADTTSASPLPAPLGTEGTHQPVPREIARQQQQKRANHRNPKKQPSPLPQLDGTVSDSVTNPIASPNSKKHTRQRQSVAAPPAQPAVMGRANGAKTRPVSFGGPLLPMTPAKEQAYAGPTFHASPAPSSLPVPKFFSRSVPNVGGPLQTRMEGDKTPEKQDQDSSPEPDVVSPVVTREAVQSPLDLLFKADKEEKSRSSSSGNMLSPEMEVRRPELATEPRNPFQHSGKSIVLRELDGNSEELPSPKTFPAPHSPAPAERAYSSPGVRPQSSEDEAQREAYTKSLKDLLFNNVNGVQPQNQTPAQTQQRAQSGAQIFKTPSPFQRPASRSGPWPAPSTEQSNDYALHYGNRNLSPLFKAARGETPTRPSSLRQELPDRGSAPIVANTAPQPRQMRHIDPNSFARDFLNQQAHSARPTSLPELPFANGGPRPAAASPSSVSGQRGASGGISLASGASSRTDGSRDLRSMEDNIKRMLQLNVSG